MGKLRRLLARIFPTTTIGETSGMTIVTWKYTPHFLVALSLAVAVYYYLYGELP